MYFIHEASWRNHEALKVQYKLSFCSQLLYMNYWLQCIFGILMFGISKKIMLTMYWERPRSVAELVGGLSHAPKGCWFSSWSGHIPRLQVRSLAKTGMGGNQSMFLSYVSVSLSHSFSSPLPLPQAPALTVPPSLSKKKKITWLA